MAEKSEMTKKYSECALNAFIETVTESLKKGEKVGLVGFGTFEVKKRAAREGVNPQTKKAIKIPAKKAPVFKAGKGLKETVNNLISSVSIYNFSISSFSYLYFSGLSFLFFFQIVLIIFEVIF